MTLCPVCGHGEGMGDLLPVTDAEAKGGSGNLAVFMTGEDEALRLLTVAFQWNGLLQQPEGPVTLTLPAALVEGYVLFLLGPDGSSTPIQIRSAVGDEVVFDLDFLPDGEATPVLLLQLISRE